MGAVCISCSNDDNVAEVVDNTRYYVKYTADFHSSLINSPKTVTVNTEIGVQTFNLSETTRTVTWEETFGPVKKGFVASISCTMNQKWSQADYGVAAKISISRDKEPFTLKKEATGETSVSINHQIE